MTRRELRYLFIIHTLSLYQHHLIEDTNRHIAAVEAQANQQLETLLQRQVEIDGKVLDTWQENTQLLWQELETVKAKPKVKAGPKSKRRERAEEWQ